MTHASGADLLPKPATLLDGVNRLTPSRLGKFQVTKVEDLRPAINILVYGDSGVGKTRLAGSSFDVEELKEVLFIDLEGGLLTLRKTYPGVRAVRVMSWDQMQEVYDELLVGNHPYKTIVIDSLTEAQKFNMNDVMLKMVKAALDDDKDRDPDIPGLREWGKNTEQIRKFVRAFRDLPYSCVFTSLVKDDQNKKTGKVVKRPDLPGKLAVQVPAFFDVVGYYSIKEDPNNKANQLRVLQFAATETVVAKDRSNSLPEIVVNPTMTTLYDYIIKGVPKS